MVNSGTNSRVLSHQVQIVPSRVRAAENCAPQNTRATPNDCSVSITLGVLEPSLPPLPSLP